ncbi:MAG: glycosyltransferase [Deltaproteobacteria bacterium]|nr:glycosyltransferase [Deltaproteobacteria bacterium]
MAKKKQKKNKKNTRSVSRPSPRISLCMIVKDEEKFLPQCLNSVKDYVDEMIIVDTGSTDRTVEIAESYGARIYHHPWGNNFSKHRNQSISYATGDWLLILDADEEIDKATGLLLKKAVRQTDAVSISVIVRSYLEEGSYYNESISPRLFKNGTGFHYVGFVHNQPVIKGKIEMYPVVIWHYGYDLDREKKKKKKEHSLKLLLEQARRFPDDAPTFHHLSMTYFSLREWDMAIQESLKTIEMVEKKGMKDAGYSWTYYILVDSMIELGRIDEAEEWGLKGLKFYDKTPDLFFLLTEISFRKRIYDRVLEYGKEFFRLKKLLKENPSEFGFVVFQTVNREWKVCHSMGYAYLRLNDRENACHFLKEAVNKAPDPDKNGLRQEIGINWIKFKDFEKAIYFLEGLPHDNGKYKEGLKALCMLYEEQGLYQKLDALCKVLEQAFTDDFEIPFKRGVALMKLGDLKGAGVCFGRAAEINPGHVNSFINWGVTLENLRENELAIEKYLTALELEPDSPMGNLNLGIFYFKDKDYLKSEDYLARASSYFPENIYLQLALARSYLEAGEIEAVIGVCEKALRILDLPPDLLIESLSQVAELFIGIAEKLLQEKKLESFDIASDIAKHLSPESTCGFKRLSRLAFDLGEPMRAASILEIVLSIDPKDPEILSLAQGHIKKLEG